MLIYVQTKLSFGVNLLRRYLANRVTDAPYHDQRIFFFFLHPKQEQILIISLGIVLVNA